MDYDLDEKTRIMVPAVMRETYSAVAAGRPASGVEPYDRMAGREAVLIEGYATYAGCRKFSVSSRIRGPGTGAQ